MIKIENFEVVGMEHAIRGMRNPMNSWDKSDSEYHIDCDRTPCGECPINEEKRRGNYEYCSDALAVCDSKVGPNDITLMKKLAVGGPVHAKYRRMITVYLDITAPLYWWKEFDTYKVGTVANSCSTMHKIHEKEFTMEDFSCEHLMDLNEARNSNLWLFGIDGIGTPPYGVLVHTVEMLNKCRDKYIELSNMSKDDWETAPRAAVLENSSLEEAKKIIWWQMIQLLPSSYNQKRTIMLNYEVLTGIYESRNNHKLDEWREFCKWIEQLPYSEIITGIGNPSEKVNGERAGEEE